jgi:hypothetical protein
MLINLNETLMRAGEKEEVVEHEITLCLYGERRSSILRAEFETHLLVSQLTLALDHAFQVPVLECKYRMLEHLFPLVD